MARCIKYVLHDDLGQKNWTTRYILARHYLYGWFSQFHSCGTYSVLSWSHSNVGSARASIAPLTCAVKDKSTERQTWVTYTENVSIKLQLLKQSVSYNYCYHVDVLLHMGISFKLPLQNHYNKDWTCKDKDLTRQGQGLHLQLLAVSYR